MATAAYILRLQEQIDYRFSDVTLLERALTAPGVEGDKGGNKAERDRYEGNRKLARYGDSVLQLLILQKSLFEEESELNYANDTLRIAALKERHEERAKFFQIDSHMKLSPRQEGRASTRTLSLAVCAIFGACLKDSGNLSVVRSVIDHFGIRPDPEDARRHVGLGPTRSHVTNGHLTIRNASVALENDLDTSSNTSIEMNYGFLNNEARDHPAYPMTYEGPTTTDFWTFGTTEPGEASLLSYCETGNFNGEILPGFPGRGQVGYTHSDSASTSQHFMSEFFMDIDASGQIAMSPPGSLFENSFRTPIRDLDGSLHDGSDETVSQNQSQMRATKQVPTQMASVSEKRKRPSSNGDNIEAYILLEKERCLTQGFPCPEEGFKSIIGHASTQSLKIQEAMRELKIFYFAIASPASIAALKSIISVQRRSPQGKLPMPNWDLQLAERIRAVETLSENFAYVRLIRRCHVQQIFVDSSATTLKTSDGFVNFTAENISARPRSQIGNPWNIDDSKISKLIMKEIFPQLDDSTREYSPKLVYVKKLRKLGQRLDMMVNKFGYGILGLMPSAMDVSAVEPILNITDSLILKFQDDTFRWFIDCLDRLQGELLRNMSRATDEIVMAISRGALDPSTRYGIEKLSTEELKNHPRGSPLILEALYSPVSNVIM